MAPSRSFAARGDRAPVERALGAAVEHHDSFGYDSHLATMTHSSASLQRLSWRLEPQSMLSHDARYSTHFPCGKEESGVRLWPCSRAVNRIIAA